MNSVESSGNLENQVERVNAIGDKETFSHSTTIRRALLLAFYTVFGAVLFIVYLLAFVLCVAGSHFIDAVRRKPLFRFELPSEEDRRNESILLAPGTNVFFGVIGDFLYLVALVILCTCGIVYLMILWANWPKNKDVKRKQIAKWFKKSRGCVILVPHIAAIIFNCCGIIHYQFYCMVGAIDSKHNCTPVYNGYTFLVGPAGITGVSLLVAVIFCLGFPGYYYAKHRLEQDTAPSAN